MRWLQRLGLDVVLTCKPELQDTAATPSVTGKRGRPCKCLERAIPCKHSMKKFGVFERASQSDWFRGKGRLQLNTWIMGLPEETRLATIEESNRVGGGVRHDSKGALATPRTLFIVM